MMFITAHATNTSGKAGNSQNRADSGNNYARPATQKRNGPQSMSGFYQQYGTSALGATAKTRGKLAPITRVTRGR